MLASAALPGSTTGRLLITNLQTGETTAQYTQAHDIYTWSPDAHYVAFLADPQSPHARIAPLGGESVPVHGDKEIVAIDVHWVDETRYVFTAVDPQSQTLYLGEFGGANVALATVSGRSLPYDLVY